MDGENFNVADLFNVMDMHGHSGHGFQSKQGKFLTPQQILGSLNALKMLLQVMFFIDYQHCLDVKHADLEYHYAFAMALGL